MDFWNSKLKIKNLEIPRFMSAPMDGITDSPLRQMIRSFSKDELLFTEMRHVASVANEKEGQSLKYKELEKPLCFQFAATKVDFIEEAVNKVLPHNFEMLNFNACCPAKNIIKSGGGASLMGNPKKLIAILNEFNKHIKNEVPFTIKLRAGFKEKNVIEIAQMAQDLGLDAVIIHPRTQVEMFGGTPDIALVAELKKALTIPLIYSGNITTFAFAKEVYEQTGVDGFMVGRALMGTPWKLEEIKAEGKNETFTISFDEALTHAYKHFQLNLEYYGRENFQIFKKHLTGYIKNVPNASEIRHSLFLIDNLELFELEFKKLLQKC
ncbi:TPA: hypothetical protein DEO28_01605 [Candidatus Dependentiae bacterium]|nr:MAG: tRNA-dihydrouridine synthase [candidate division TM6 bacterium GW2011_GWE2_31_21]KKP52930.1 MAG: tRNA-dihydrouridine synthase [candidate division TM6 bacterium GW2011_GWF2_33_332]HBS47829.1 hypothetical protein [Candidatus Dependentiae bacterium]HBZ73195.1 hypothetical protein [Candidatus Dependentiae bacterium]